MNAFTDGLGIDAPIVLGPFGGASSVDLTAAVSDLGGLGSFGLYGFDAERIEQTAAEIRARTERPFALNLWVPTGDEATPDELDWDDVVAPLAPLFEAVDVPLPQRPAAFLPDYSSQLDAVIAARPAVLSLVFGVPDAALVDRARAAGIRIVGTATTVAEAVALEAAGVDAVAATGFEAGGHRVSWLRPAEESLTGGLSLVPAVVDAVSVPVIAAGGIADRRGVAASFALGASAVQVGTAFLRAVESGIPDSHRTAIDAVGETGTVLTRAMSGRLARGVRNEAVERIERSGRIAPFPAQNWLTGVFRAEAKRRDDPAFQSLWSGQSAPLIRGATAAEVFAELAAGVPRG